MRMTKQLRAQANGLKFASQLMTKTSFKSHISPPYPDFPKSDGQSKTLTTNEPDEHSQAFVPSNEFIKCPPMIDESDVDDNDKLKPMISSNNTERKTPMIISTSRSENYLYDEKNRLKITKYNYEDIASLNSTPILDDDVML